MTDRYASLKQGLVGCWIPSVSGSGLLLPDLSGRGNSGSLVGMDASDWVSASYGRALDIFDDQYIDGGTMQELSLAYPFSMSCWIQNITSNNVDFSPFAKTRQVGTYQGPMIYFASATNATVVAYWAGGTRATGATVVTQLSNWTHVGICWTGSQARVYVNGRLDGTGNTATAPNASTASVNIGRYNSEGFGQRSMRGRIDDCRIYDRCLTDSEWSLLASEPGIGFKPAKKLSRFSQRFTYKPAKPRNYSVIRNRDPNYSTLRQGLVAAYCPSISGQGNVLPDLVGGNHGTLTNMDASDWVSSGDGRALDFDGVNDFVSVPRISAFNSTQWRTLSAWIYARSFDGVSGFNDILSCDFIGGTREWNLVTSSDANLNDAKLLIGLFGTGGGEVNAQTPEIILANEWTHISVTQDGSYTFAGYSMYINGKKQVTTDVSTGTFTAPSVGTSNLGIGRRPGAASQDLHWNGQIDDVRLYSRVLTEPEIKLLASKRGIGLQPRNTHVTFADLGVQKTYSVVRVKETDYATLRQGLVGAWCPSLPNGGGGNTLPDVSGYGNHGVLTNMSPDDWVSGQYGRALDFDGSNDYVDTGTQLSFLDGNSEFTMCFWGQRRSSGAALTVGKRSGGNYILIAPWIDGNVYFELTSYFPAVASNLTSWAHYAMTLRGATIRGYINGSQVVSTAGPSTVPSVSANYVMGLEAGVPRYSDGGIDDFRIYSRALTEPEIRLLASRPGIGLRQDRDRNTFYQFPSFQPAIARRSSAIIGGGIT